MRLIYLTKQTFNRLVQLAVEVLPIEFIYLNRVVGVLAHALWIVKLHGIVLKTIQFWHKMLGCVAVTVLDRQFACIQKNIMLFSAIRDQPKHQQTFQKMTEVIKLVMTSKKLLIFISGLYKVIQLQFLLQVNKYRSPNKTLGMFIQTDTILTAFQRIQLRRS